MSCFAPVTAWYTKEVIDGKRQITFQRHQAHFPAPLKLPCGKCFGCLQARGRQWAMRCEHERKLHTENCFITLTYDPEKIPKGHTLVKRDLQLFLKRLRKKLEPKKVRYYACGEYGEKTGRPHYHILLFGWDAPATDRRVLRRTAGDHELYNSLTINSAWPSGHAVCGSITAASCLYVASYLSKNFGRKWQQRDAVCQDGEVIRLQPEFAIMSKRPGIGAGYVSRYSDELLAHDNVIVEGRECSLPRYYDQRLLKEEHTTAEKMLELKDSRRREARQFKKENTPERRRVRESVALQTFKHFQKGEI